jgi:hypothetical protein
MSLNSAGTNPNTYPGCLQPKSETETLTGRARRASEALNQFLRRMATLPGYIGRMAETAHRLISDHVSAELALAEHRNPYKQMYAQAAANWIDVVLTQPPAPIIIQKPASHQITPVLLDKALGAVGGRVTLHSDMETLCYALNEIVEKGDVSPSCAFNPDTKEFVADVWDGERWRLGFTPKPVPENLVGPATEPQIVVDELSDEHTVGDHLDSLEKRLTDAEEMIRALTHDSENWGGQLHQLHERTLSTLRQLHNLALKCGEEICSLDQGLTRLAKHVNREIGVAESTPLHMRVKADADVLNSLTKKTRKSRRGK